MPILLFFTTAFARFRALPGYGAVARCQNYSERKLSGSRTLIYSSSISQNLARFGEADFARLRRQSRRIAARNFGKSVIRLTGIRDCAPAAAAYGANPPAAPPNWRERDTISALAGARRRPLGAAVAQSRARGEDQAANTRRKSGSPKLLTANLWRGGATFLSPRNTELVCDQTKSSTFRSGNRREARRDAGKTKSFAKKSVFEKVFLLLRTEWG